MAFSAQANFPRAESAGSLYDSWAANAPKLVGVYTQDALPINKFSLFSLSSHISILGVNLRLSSSSVPREECNDKPTMVAWFGGSALHSVDLRVDSPCP